MIFTTRDAEILRWINGHGFAADHQVADWLGIRYQSIHPRLKFMAEAGFLRSDRIGHNLLALRLTKVCICKFGDDLPPLKTIRFGSLLHDLQLIDLATRLARETGGHWTTERRLRQQRASKGVGVHGHVSDGLLKLEGYAADFDLGEVWYFAGNEAPHRQLERAAVGYAFVRVFEFDAENGL